MARVMSLVEWGRLAAPASPEIVRACFDVTSWHLEQSGIKDVVSQANPPGASVWLRTPDGTQYGWLRLDHSRFTAPPGSESGTPGLIQPDYMLDVRRNGAGSALDRHITLGCAFGNGYLRVAAREESIDGQMLAVRRVTARRLEAVTGSGVRNASFTVVTLERSPGDGLTNPNEFRESSVVYDDLATFGEFIGDVLDRAAVLARPPETNPHDIS